MQLGCNYIFKNPYKLHYSECPRTSFMCGVEFGSANANWKASSIMKDRILNESTKSHFRLFKYSLRSHLTKLLFSWIFLKATLWILFLLPTEALPFKLFSTCCTTKSRYVVLELWWNCTLHAILLKNFTSLLNHRNKASQMLSKIPGGPLVLKKREVQFTLIRQHICSCISCALWNAQGIMAPPFLRKSMSFVNIFFYARWPRRVFYRTLQGSWEMKSFWQKICTDCTSIEVETSITSKHET